MGSTLSDRGLDGVILENNHDILQRPPWLLPSFMVLVHAWLGRRMCSQQLVPFQHVSCALHRRTRDVDAVLTAANELTCLPLDTSLFLPGHLEPRYGIGSNESIVSMACLFRPRLYWRRSAMEKLDMPTHDTLKLYHWPLTTCMKP